MAVDREHEFDNDDDAARAARFVELLTAHQRNLYAYIATLLAGDSATADVLRMWIYGPVRRILITAARFFPGRSPSLDSASWLFASHSHALGS